MKSVEAVKSPFRSRKSVEEGKEDFIVESHGGVSTEQETIPFHIKEKQQYRLHPERPFTRAERTHTTILFGGLTWKHEELILAVFRGLGYKAEYLPAPQLQAYQRGKDHCNNGYCNPAYFTIGNLIHHLTALRDSGIPAAEIVDSYVFFTAGACGPCRFGMYEAEYRHALKNAGFEGFRIITIQQLGGLDQSESNDGLVLNLDFTIGLIYAFLIGDLLNDIGYRLRPYESEQGETDSALAASIRLMSGIMEKKMQSCSASEKTADGNRIRKTRNHLIRLFRYLIAPDVTRGLQQCWALFEKIRLDRMQVKPVVKITGEFWAQTTEGDGNYKLFSFLESEGAEVYVEPITPWLLYMLHQSTQSLRDRRFLELNRRSSLGGLWREMMEYFSMRVRYRLAEKLLLRKYQHGKSIMNGLPQELQDQYHLQRIAHPYYNSRIEGGEGHLEIAKTIYCAQERTCHLVLSVKPFGCLPSTQSDGVQSLVTEHYPDILFLPMETSGDGEIHAHSRVQMALTEARQRAQQEFESVLEQRKSSISEIISYMNQHPELAYPSFRFIRKKGVTGTAVHFIESITGKVAKVRKKSGDA
jgi:predicted nucleotide-binding protein (sugar kinase/HSP70/actin superfamily)